VRQSTRSLSVAGVPIVPSGEGAPMSVYVSINGTLSTRRRALLPSPLTEKASGLSGTVQKKPFGKIPPLMS
jgi:hypothetical protein